jgi:hypothetical protein
LVISLKFFEIHQKFLITLFSPVNRDIKMAPPCKRYRKVYTWQVSSIRHIITIAEFATLGGCRSPRHTGEEGWKITFLRLFHYPCEIRLSKFIYIYNELIT